MADTIKTGIIGGGWPGMAHARGYQAAGGYRLAAVADLIPERRRKLMSQFGIEREYERAEELIADKEIQAVSLCIPNDLHQPLAVAALGAGKHVICESPPALDAAGARKMMRAMRRSGKVLMYAMQRRFGGAEQAARQAVAKGYAGEVYHARAAWTRTRGIPAGTGWYTDKSRSGGGVMIDLGIHILDLAWSLLGETKPLNVTAVAHQRFGDDAGGARVYDVEDAVAVLMRFEGGKTLELTAAWALNQAPQQNGALCRVYGDKAAIEVYTPQGAILYRDFNAGGGARATALRPPKMTHQAAMMRHFRQSMQGNAQAETGAEKGVALMGMIDAIYKSIATGKSVDIKTEPGGQLSPPPSSRERKLHMPALRTKTE